MVNSNYNNRIYSKIMRKLSEIMVIDNNRINGNKKCCIKTAQEVYEYEGLIVKE